MIFCAIKTNQIIYLLKNGYSQKFCNKLFNFYKIFLIFLDLPCLSLFIIEIRMSQSKPEREPMYKRSLWKVLVSDVSSALLTALSVTPFVTIIDKAVIKNANGSTPLWTAIGTGIKDLVT